MFRIDTLPTNQLLLNSEPLFFQRIGTGALPYALTTSWTYLADRWQSAKVGTIGTASISRLLLNDTYSWVFLLTYAAQTGGFTHAQKIEAIRSRKVAGKKMSVSFNFKQTSQIVGSTLELILRVPTAKDDYTAYTQVFNSIQAVSSLLINSDHEISFENIDIPTSAINGLQVDIQYKTASSVTGSNTITLSPVMVNEGKVKQAHTRYDEDIELLMCQRYYEKTTHPDQGITYGSYSVGMNLFNMTGLLLTRAMAANGYTDFKVYKRSIPTFRVYTVTGVENYCNLYNDPGITLYISGKPIPNQQGFSGYFATTGSFATSMWQLQWTADAEIS